MFSVYIVDACEPLKLLSSFSIWARGDLSLWHCCNARPLTSQPAAASLESFLEEHLSSETFSSIFCFSLSFFFMSFLTCLHTCVLNAGSPQGKYIPSFLYCRCFTHDLIAKDFMLMLLLAGIVHTGSWDALQGTRQTVCVRDCEVDKEAKKN